MRAPGPKAGRLCVGVWLLCVLSCARAAGAQEFQSWNEVDLTGRWHGLNLLAPFVARLQPGAANPQLAATGLMVDIPLTHSLLLTPGYLFAELPQLSDAVHLPLIAVTPQVQTHGLLLTDRNRFEKLIGYPGAPVRYRNRILADWQLGPAKRLHAFIDDEALFNLTVGNFNQNRFQAGVGSRFDRRCGLDLYYLRKSPSGGTPINVLGATLRVNVLSR